MRCKSDIETCGFSDIIFAPNARRHITFNQRQSRCISSRRSLAYHPQSVAVYHHCESRIQPTADDIHASRDDMRLTAMICHCFRNG
ncbi:MAG: hypothetical protein IKU23_03815 [Clostridia bacterium]|nr:hypothetical protein [Clostridia bacterium]